LYSGTLAAASGGANELPLCRYCRRAITGGWYPGNAVWQTLREGQAPDDFYFTDLYLARYPQLATVLEDPGINHVWRNVFYRCGTTMQDGRFTYDQRDNVQCDDSDRIFVDAAAGDFRLRPDVPALTTGFEPLPVEEMGLYADEHRPSWPVDTSAEFTLGWRTSD